MRLKISLSEVGCQKPGCRRKLLTPHRHHTGNEAFLISELRIVLRWGILNEELKRVYSSLIRRYNKFLPKDTVTLCPWHHAEIHEIFEHMYFEMRSKDSTPIHLMTPGQFLRFRHAFRSACSGWMKEVTPGVNPRKVLGMDRTGKGWK